MTRTKVICTIGPASQSEKALPRLVVSGMDIARLNFSHGSPEWHRNTFRLLRRISKEMGHNLAILQDLPGPKIRLGPLLESKALLKKGSPFILTGKRIPDKKTDDILKEVDRSIRTHSIARRGDPLVFIMV